MEILLRISGIIVVILSILLVFEVIYRHTYSIYDIIVFFITAITAAFGGICIIYSLK